MSGKNLICWGLICWACGPHNRQTDRQTKTRPDRQTSYCSKTRPS